MDGFFFVDIGMSLLVNESGEILLSVSKFEYLIGRSSSSFIHYILMLHSSHYNQLGCIQLIVIPKICITRNEVHILPQWNDVIRVNVHCNEIRDYHILVLLSFEEFTLLLLIYSCTWLHVRCFKSIFWT